MGRYTKEQRIFIVEQYFKSNEGLSATVRTFRTKYGRHSELKPSTVKRIIQKFRETGSISDLEHPGCPVTSRSTENIEAVRESIADSPGTSIRHRSQELGISRSSLQRILTKDLKLHANKVQLTQELKTTDHAARREFVERKTTKNFKNVCRLRVQNQVQQELQDNPKEHALRCGKKVANP